VTSGSGPRAAVVPPPGADGGPPLSDRGWRVTLAVLHTAFAVALGAAATEAILRETGAERAVLLAAVAVLGLVYVAAGRRALDLGARHSAVAYLIVLVAVVAVFGWVLPELLFVMFVVSPQVWFLVASVRAGVLWTLAVGAAALAGPLVHWTQGDEPLHGPGQTLVGITLSLAMGLWVTRVLEQSRSRAALIAELERTRSELATAERERGVLAERERLAREVHDTLAQGYTSIVVLAQSAAAQVDADPATARERLLLIEEVARDNLAEARAVVAAFRPVALDGSTLVEALERLAERFARETGLAVRVDTAALGGGVALRRDEEVVLLRGAQEALTNVRRHAGASAVVVRVSRVAGQVSVHVEDDGVGFDPAAVAGAGLEGLRGRVEQVGGEVDVASAPGEGTRVTVRVPGS
jgi:signal transduction histidine kinase